MQILSLDRPPLHIRYSGISFKAYKLLILAYITEAICMERTFQRETFRFTPHAHLKQTELEVHEMHFCALTCWHRLHGWNGLAHSSKTNYDVNAFLKTQLNLWPRLHPLQYWYWSINRTTNRVKARFAIWSHSEVIKKKHRIRSVHANASRCGWEGPPTHLSIKHCMSSIKASD